MIPQLDTGITWWITVCLAVTAWASRPVHRAARPAWRSAAPLVIHAATAIYTAIGAVIVPDALAMAWYAMCLVCAGMTWTGRASWASSLVACLCAVWALTWAAAVSSSWATQSMLWGPALQAVACALSCGVSAATEALAVCSAAAESTLVASPSMQEQLLEPMLRNASHAHPEPVSAPEYGVALRWLSPWLSAGIAPEDIHVHTLPKPPTSTLHQSIADPGHGLLQLLLRTAGVSWLLLAIPQLVQTAAALGSPVLLHALLNELVGQHASLQSAAWLAGALLAVVCAGACAGVVQSYRTTVLQARVRTALLTSVTQAGLQLSAAARAAFVPGIAADIVAVDTQTILDVVSSAHQLWALPAQVLGTLLLLYWQLQWAFIAGLAVLVLFVPLNMLLASKIGRLTSTMLHERDLRVGLLQRILDAVRPLKARGLEAMAARRVQQHRTLELRALAGRKYLDAVCVFLWAFTPVLMSAATFTVMSMLSSLPATPARVFTAVMLLGQLVFPLNAYAWVVSGIVEARISAQRVCGLLGAAGPARQSNLAHAPPDTRPGLLLTSRVPAIATAPALQVQGQFAPSGEVKPVVEFTSALRIPLPAVVGVYGAVGAGKTAVLDVVCGGLWQPVYASTQVTYPAKCLVCQVSQHPWVAGSTIAQALARRIPEGAVLHASQHFTTALHTAALRDWVDTQPDGVHTSIAAGGHSLSGGQRARLGLAAALVAAGWWCDQHPSHTAVIAIDHITAALDDSTGDVLWRRLIAWAEARACLVLAVEHSAPRLRQCTHVLHAQHGQVTMGDAASAVGSPAPGASTDHAAPEQAEQELVASDSPAKSDKARVGTVQLATAVTYARALTWPGVGLIVFSLVAMQGSRNGFDWALSQWSQQASTDRSAQLPIKWLLVLAAINGAAVAVRAGSFAASSMAAAKWLHDHVLARVLAAGISWWHSRPPGAVLNRFAADQYAVDSALPFQLNILLAQVFGLAGSLVVMSIASGPTLFVGLPVLAWLYVRLAGKYRAGARELRRLQAATLTPIFSELHDVCTAGSAGTAAVGAEAAGMDLACVRAAGLGCQREAARFKPLVHANSTAWFTSAAAGTWLVARLQALGVCLVALTLAAALASVAMSGSAHAGALGLALAYALPIVSSLQQCVTSLSDTEKELIAVERCAEYAAQAPETASVLADIKEVLQTRDDGEVSCPVLRQEGEYCGSADLDGRAAIEIQHLVLRYDAAKPPALDLTSHVLAVWPDRPVAIVGASGSGKSTLVNAIVRLTPPALHGCIMVQSRPVEQWRLHALRQQVLVVPQEPLVLGSVRDMVDPQHACSDAQVLAALGEVGLALHGALQATARPGHTQVPVSDLDTALPSDKLSSGTVQLLQCALVLLSDKRIVLLDEVSGRLPPAAQAQCTAALATALRGRAAIIIAHRLETIEHCAEVWHFHCGMLQMRGTPAQVLPTLQGEAWQQHQGAHGQPGP